MPYDNTHIDHIIPATPPLHNVGHTHCCLSRQTDWLVKKQAQNTVSKAMRDAGLRIAAHIYAIVLIRGAPSVAKEVPPLTSQYKYNNNKLFETNFTHVGLTLIHARI